MRLPCIALGLLNDAQIAQAIGLSIAQVEALRSQPPAELRRSTNWPGPQQRLYS